MREIPVLSLGTDKLRVEAGETGGYVVTDSADGEIVGIVDPGIPTEALLAIVADRLREAADDTPAQWARAAVDYARRTLEP